MNILIVNGSHRTHGNSWRFSRFAKQTLEETGHRVSVVDLATENIEFCTGCLSCEEAVGCVVNDAFTNSLIPKIQENDMIIFATPVYYDMPTAMMINFIDRSNSLYKYFKKASKSVACFLVGQADLDSLSFAHECLKEYFMILKFKEVGEPIMKIARDPDELVLDDEIKQQILNWVK